MKKTCCIICYRLCSESSSYSDLSENHSQTSEFKDYPDKPEIPLLRRFFDLLGRHLNHKNELRKACQNLNVEVEVGSGTKQFPMEQILKAGMSACGDCLRMMESFCDIFHQMKALELKLDWKLWTVKNIMLQAERVPSRVKDFKRTVEQHQHQVQDESADTSKDLILNFRKKLVRNCSQKLLTSFPKLFINDCRNGMKDKLIGTPISTTCTKNADRINAIKKSSIIVEESGTKDTGHLSNDGSGSDHYEGIPTLDFDDDMERNSNMTRLSISLNPDLKMGHLKLETVEASSKPEEGQPINDTQAGNINSPEIKSESRAMCSESDDDHDNFETLDITGSPVMNLVEFSNDNENCNDMETSNLICKITKPVPSVSITGCDPLPGSSGMGTGEVLPSGRTLRSVHRCNTCIRTFSTAQRLAEHQRSESCEGGEEAEDDENDGSSYADTSTTGTSDYDSDSDDEHPAEMEDVAVTTSKVTGPPPKTFYRFRCPDCNKLFLLLHSLLLHREKWHPIQSQATLEKDTGSELNKPSLITINILSFLKKPGAMISDKQEDFKIYAAISVPEKLFMCQLKNCGEPFYSPDDLEAHSKLHGNFKCNFCDATKEYAPELAEHELKHVTGDDGTGKRITCPRCKVSLPNISRYSLHHLKEHMNLTKNSNACAICKTCTVRDDNPHQFRRSLLKRYSDIKNIFLHYKIKHDKLERDPDKMFSCGMSECGAYFLTNRQLLIHRKLRHNIDISQWKAKNKESWICKDCEKCFASKSSLQRHRIQYHLRTEDLIPCTFKDCKSKFETRRELAKHGMIHKSAYSRKCPKCRVEFYNKGAFTMHLKSHGNPRRRRTLQGWLRKDIAKNPEQNYYRFKCPNCNKLFKRIYQLQRHREESHPDLENQALTKIDIISNMQGFEVGSLDRIKNFKVAANLDVPPLKLYSCPFEKCQEPFYSQEELENHSKLHGHFKCNFCDEVKEFAQELAVHELQHGEKTDDDHRKDGTLKCNRCQLIFLHEVRYIRHYLTTHLSLPYFGEVCTICKTFRSPVLRELIRHYLNSHNLINMNLESVHRCKIDNCSAYFPTKKGLAAHQTILHSVDKPQRQIMKFKSYPCLDCKKMFSDPSYLKNHRLTFHVKPSSLHRCPVEECSFASETKTELTKHTRLMHSSSSTDKLEKCPKCGRLCVKGGALMRHLLSHNKLLKGQTPAEKHVCEICGKVFKLKTHLQQHSVYHSGPRNYKFKCSVCPKRCPSKQKLQVHMVSHTKEQPYVCQICGNKYAHRYSLRNHVNSKHGDVTEDKARKVDRTNATSTKGLKRGQKVYACKSTSESDGGTD